MRVLDGPGGAVGQAADRRAGMMPIESPISSSRSRSFSRPAAGLDPLDHLQRPVRAFAAGRALAAAFVGEEAATVVQEIDHRIRLVEHHHAGRAQPQAADLAGAGEIQRRVEFVGSRIRPMLIPPGIAAFALRPFHTPPPYSSISSPHGDAQRRLVAAGPVHVAAQAVQLRAVAAGIAGIVRIGRHADRLEPVGAAIDDVLHAGTASRRC